MDIEPTQPLSDSDKPLGAPPSSRESVAPPVAVANNNSVISLQRWENEGGRTRLTGLYDFADQPPSPRSLESTVLGQVLDDVGKGDSDR